MIKEIWFHISSSSFLPLLSAKQKISAWPCIGIKIKFDSYEANALFPTLQNQVKAFMLIYSWFQKNSEKVGVKKRGGRMYLK